MASSSNDPKSSSPSRSPSSNSRGPHPHAPTNPSGLRNARAIDDSPEADSHEFDSPNRIPSSSQNLPRTERDGILPTNSAGADPFSDEEDTHVEGYTVSKAKPNLRTRLLDQQQGQTPNGYGTTDTNGQRSPRPPSFRTVGSFDSVNTTLNFAARFLPASLLRRSTTDDPLTEQEMDMTTLLSARHGITDKRKMYFLYYFPFANWIRQYRWAYLKGDLVSAFTMASFYLPMSLSYAANLGHIAPINGLYSFVFNPFIYALLGTCPQMVVGPEAAGSLLTGQVVRENIKHGRHTEDDAAKNAQIAGMVTGVAGAVILLAGLCRLGFLDSVLSRPFLRGFISAIGIVILVDQLLPEMGLDGLAEHVAGAAHGSSLEKIIFLSNYWREAHGLTCAVGFGSFAIVMVCREIKKRLQPRMHWVAYIPDRFTVVVLSAVLAWAFQWQDQGLDILGDIQEHGRSFKVHFPFTPNLLEHATDAFGTGILIALLGFFESSVAAKSLGNSPTKSVEHKQSEDEDEEPDGIRNMMVSPNRELVALGVANIVGGLFMALPAFGGYGRSKVNASTGGKTPMSSVFLSIITVICILFLLPYFYYIPVSAHCGLKVIKLMLTLAEMRTFGHDICCSLLFDRGGTP